MFATSGLVLVVEILAGRLVAPYVGVSLESFTAIIGTVLAGIAAGAAIGGWFADRIDPRRLIGPAIVTGGVLVWLSVPIVRTLGPALGSAPIEIVILTAAAFLLPAAVLSAVSPMVAKLSLTSVEETGAVVGGLSAAGTVGALVGTFITGFVLVAIAPVRTIMLIVGALLIAIGVAAWWKLGSTKPTLPGAAGVALAAFALISVPSPCDIETEYFCVNIEVDRDQPSARSLWLDQLRHGFVDLDDPTVLDIRYIRLLADVAETLPAGPIDALHIGGGAFSLPRHIAAVRPGSSALVLEIDQGLVDIAEEQLGLVTSDLLQVQVGDGRLALDALADDSYDLIVGDAFASEAAPWHLTTTEFIAELDRVLRPDGVYAMNIIDGPDANFAAAELATLAEHFEFIGVVEPTNVQESQRRYNRLLLASDVPLIEPDFNPDDGQLVLGDPWGHGQVLTDDFAPVDQLLD